MRCLNCNTACMDTDVVCVSCRMPLPPPAPEDAPPAAAFMGPVLRWVCGIFLVLFSGFLAICAGGLCLDGQEIEKKGALKVTADDLLKLKGPEDLADNWVSYTFPKATFTGWEIASMRPGNKTKGRFLFAQVKDRWLLAYVPPDFSGSVLEGELETWNSPMYRDLMLKLGQGYRAETKAMLPFLLNCEYGRAAHYRPRYFFAAACGVAALCLFWKGVRMPFTRPATAADEADRARAQLQRRRAA